MNAALSLLVLLSCCLDIARGAPLLDARQTVPLSEPKLPDLPRGPDHNLIHATIAKGLQPSAEIGQDERDPLLYRHRFQHHDEHTDSLTYFQYEARRLPSVKFVRATDVKSCSMIKEDPTSKIANISLAFSSRAIEIEKGSVLLLADGCISKETGKAEALHGHVLASSVTSPLDGRSDLTELHLTTSHAELHDVFEYSHIEYFRGKTANLELSRGKWIQSLKKHGFAKKTVDFAETAHIVKEAKMASAAASARSMAAVAADAAEAVSPTPSARSEHEFLPLHPLTSGDQSGSRFHAGNGTDSARFASFGGGAGCTRDYKHSGSCAVSNLNLSPGPGSSQKCVPQEVKLKKDCWAQEANKNYVLQLGGTYTFTWDHESPCSDMSFRFLLREIDDLFNDDCAWVSDEVRMSQGQATITMPSQEQLDSQSRGCANDGLGG